MMIRITLKIFEAWKKKNLIFLRLSEEQVTVVKNILRSPNSTLLAVPEN